VVAVLSPKLLKVNASGLVQLLRHLIIQSINHLLEGERGARKHTQKGKAVKFESRWRQQKFLALPKLCLGRRLKWRCSCNTPALSVNLYPLTSCE
jgi:hypothetical protein